MERDSPFYWTKLGEKTSYTNRRKNHLLPATQGICKGRNNKAFISCGPFQPYPLCVSLIPLRQRNVIMENPLAAKLIRSAPRQRLMQQIQLFWFPSISSKVLRLHNTVCRSAQTFLLLRSVRKGWGVKVVGKAFRLGLSHCTWCHQHPSWGCTFCFLGVVAP